jgi:hypothetical protein
VAIRREKKHVGRFAFPACRCEGFIASGNQAGVFSEGRLFPSHLIRKTSAGHRFAGLE